VERLGARVVVLAVRDAASGRRELHAAALDHLVIAERVPVFDAARDDVREDLIVAVRMLVKALWRVRVCRVRVRVCVCGAKGVSVASMQA
jgi:hypothetical protein